MKLEKKLRTHCVETPMQENNHLKLPQMSKFSICIEKNNGIDAKDVYF
jgi:hypothetical protein